MRHLLLACTALATIAAAPASAAIMSGSFGMTVTTGAFPATSADPFVAIPAGSATASFTYTGSLNFGLVTPQNFTNAGDLNSAFFATATNAGAGASYGITGYSGSGNYAAANANFGAGVSGFLAASASAGTYAYGSLYAIQLGTLVAGTVLTITHDDGITLYQGTTKVGSTINGPTVAVTDKVTIGTTGATTLYYTRQNGAPSVLSVDAVVPTVVTPPTPTVTGVPEPMSIALFGLGLAGLGLAVRRRSRQG